MYVMRGINALLYASGGILFIIAGVLAYYEVTYRHTLIIATVLGGGVLIVLGLIRRPPSVKAAFVFALGVAVFGILGSDIVGAPLETVETYRVTVDQYSTDAVYLEAFATAGNIQLSFSEDDNILYEINFTKTFWSWPFWEEVKAGLTNTTRNGLLYLNATADAGNIEILLGSNMRHDISLKTISGNVRFEAPPTSEIGAIYLRATSGNIRAVIKDSTHLRGLEARATTGNVKLELDIPTLEEDGSILATTSTGNIRLELGIGDDLGCNLTAETKTGDIDVYAEDFTVLEANGRHHGQTANYPQASVKLTVTLETTTGNIDAEVTK